jgi:hypothetical protein
MRTKSTAGMREMATALIACRPSSSGAASQFVHRVAEVLHNTHCWRAREGA